jgi:purine-binding chemotaxis protein CheW
MMTREERCKMTENKSGIEKDDEFYDEDDEDAQKDKYLTFHLASEEYGVEIRYVTEIIGIQKITEVPDMPEFVKGVINLRGKIIPVLDVRIRFKLEACEYNDRTCIIVVDIDDMAVGLVVDEVSEVANIPEEQVEPPPKTGKNKSSRFIKGMGKMGDEVKIILDVSKLLYDDEKEVLKEANPEEATGRQVKKKGKTKKKEPEAPSTG